VLAHDGANAVGPAAGGFEISFDLHDGHRIQKAKRRKVGNGAGRMKENLTSKEQKVRPERSERAK
jgi:hypothetical protein